MQQKATPHRHKTAPENIKNATKLHQKTLKMSPQHDDSPEDADNSILDNWKSCSNAIMENSLLGEFAAIVLAAC